jgi:hypothetical protein
MHTAQKGLERSGLLLQLLLLAALIWFRNSLQLVGVLFLIAASYLDLAGLSLAINLRKKQRRGAPESAAWALHKRAYVLFCAAWQVAVIGFLNLGALWFSGSRTSVIVGYLAATIFMILSYKMVAIADSPEQEGGSKPISYFGRPRARKLFFCAFVYTPIGPLIMMSLEWSGLKWCPVVLRPPQFWLLATTLLSLAAAALILQRYRTVTANKSLRAKVLVVTLSGLSVMAAAQIVFAHDVYMSFLSMAACACIAASFYWLSLAREENTNHEVMADTRA